jgi:hypothetical protein
LIYKLFCNFCILDHPRNFCNFRILDHPKGKLYDICYGMTEILNINCPNIILVLKYLFVNVTSSVGMLWWFYFEYFVPFNHNGKWCLKRKMYVNIYSYLWPERILFVPSMCLSCLGYLNDPKWSITNTLLIT